jgi:hypothetical protein
VAIILDRFLLYHFGVHVKNQWILCLLLDEGSNSKNKHRLERAPRRTPSPSKTTNNSSITTVIQFNQGRALQGVHFDVTEYAAANIPSAGFPDDEGLVYHKNQVHGNTGIIIAPSFEPTNKGSALSSASGCLFPKGQAYFPTAFNTGAWGTPLERRNAIELPLHLAQLTPRTSQSHCRRASLLRSSRQRELLHYRIIAAR